MAMIPPTDNPFSNFDTRVRALDEIAWTMAQATDIEGLTTALASGIAHLFPVDHAGLYLNNADKWQLHPLADLPPPEAGEHTAWALAAGLPIAAIDNTMIAVRLPESASPRGALVITRDSSNGYSPDDILLARLLAGHVATALANLERVSTLKERVDTLEQLNQELDAYDYSAAHDLKAPLNIINNYAFLILDVLQDGDRAAAAAYTGEIMHTARAMARLLDQLLTVTRAADENDIAPVTPVKPILDNVIAQLRQPLETAGITLDVSADLPAVRAYPVQLEAIFANLVGNAIKYIGKPDNPRITISSTREDKLIRFEVRDNGIGMSEAEQTRLFRRFSRVGKAEAEGTGLGLAIARRMVERLGGKLGVTSAPGQGSSFWFTLPSGGEAAEPAAL